MRRSVILGVLCSGLGATVAAAADMPVKAPIVTAPAVYQWGGFYIGGHIGGLSGSTKWSNILEPNDASFTFHQKANYTSFVGGVHGGFNYQFDRVVIGVEG